ncbi:MAG TPA: hypothetical protein VEF04_15030 [Blastocatellia bacterium]|nr:hypothetical protein [Blastocatellia bacterium]
MGIYTYRFEVVDSDLGMKPAGEIWAWKWGAWKHSASWTSEKAVDADFNTDNAKKGLQRAGNLLMIAVPSNVMSPFAKNLDFDKVNIHTFKKDDSTGTPLRTASYFTAKVIDVVPRDFRAIPNVGTKANYSEVLLKIDASVEVAA